MLAMVEPPPGGVGVGVDGVGGVTVKATLEVCVGVAAIARLLNESRARNKPSTIKGRAFFIGRRGRVVKENFFHSKVSGIRNVCISKVVARRSMGDAVRSLPDWIGIEQRVPNPYRKESGRSVVLRRFHGRVRR